MVAKILPGTYDAAGRKVFRPDSRRHGIHPTFPFGVYVTRPLTVHCSTVKEIRRFLSTCSVVADKEQFGREDYWQPPDEFERTRRGDCDCWALWTWRQLMELGWNTRFVVGGHGKNPSGHAWVTFEEGGTQYLVEPQDYNLGDRMPTLSTFRYKPCYSVQWDGKRIHYFQHEHWPVQPKFSELPGLVFEWTAIWTHFWLRVGRYILRRTRGPGLEMDPSASRSHQEEF